MKKKLLISFSGGETSAYMLWWLINHKSDEFEFVVVFANTGRENEETLIFVDRVSKLFGVVVHWVEAVVDKRKGKGTRHKAVNFETASRNGEPFKEVISKYGIPNQSFPHCTRETKLSPITSFTRQHFKTKKYYTAVGIRADEADRINKNAKELRLIYPLISEQPMTKPKINFWWSLQPFRLELKGYQGNCKTCWKKADSKLYQIATEHREYFDFELEMESIYPRTGAEFSKDPTAKDRTFFRKNRSAKQMLAESESFNGVIIDDSMTIDNDELDLIGGESCEIFAECQDT